MFRTASLLGLTEQEKIARARSDIRMGLPCTLHHPSRTTVMVAIETVGPERFQALQDLCGRPELVLTAERARAIMTPAAASNIGSGPVRICPPDLATFEWYMRLADPGNDHDGATVGPLHQLRSGDATPHHLAIELTKSAELIPAVALFTLSDSQQADVTFPFTELDVENARPALAGEPSMSSLAGACLPLEAHETSELQVFRDPSGQMEHYAIVIGSPDRSKPVLTRLHSACFTGDVLGSLKCDCGPQLRSALAQMGAEGAGVLLYLNQEGRSIGLANKMRVYELQSRGLDTVEANHRLGYEDDERDFRVAAVMLKALGIDAVRLLTNNPAKADTFEANGITIAERLPLQVGRNVHNQKYLAVKAMKSGHIL